MSDQGHQTNVAVPTPSLHRQKKEANGHKTHMNTKRKQTQTWDFKILVSFGLYTVYKNNVYL